MNLNGLYEVSAPLSVMPKTDLCTSVIREPEKLEVTVRNSDIAKFGTRDERKTKLMDYVNCRETCVHEKSTEAKILSHTEEFSRIQNGDRKMKHRKRDTGSGVSSDKSNFARAMRARMPKLPAKLVRPEINPDQQNITSEVIIAPSPNRPTYGIDCTLYFGIDRSNAPSSSTYNKKDTKEPEILRV